MEEGIIGMIYLHRLYMSLLYGGSRRMDRYCCCE